MSTLAVRLDPAPRLTSADAAAELVWAWEQLDRPDVPRGRRRRLWLEMTRFSRDLLRRTAAKPGIQRVVRAIPRGRRSSSRRIRRTARRGPPSDDEPVSRFAPQGAER